MIAQLKKCREASRGLRTSSEDQRNQVLLKTAKLLKKQQEIILEANKRDLFELPSETTPAFRDRLLLNADRLSHAVTSIEQIAALSDPNAEEVESKTLKNGLKLRRVRSPLGVILMIFESRPNVAFEAFSLSIKSANVPILRGGKESKHTTQAIYSLFSEALEACQLSRDCFWGITDPDRSLLLSLLKEPKWIDVVIPRGGEGLISFVVENSRIPIIKNDRGLCHVYVHEEGDLDMARAVIVNAKTHRPGVCNAMETLLVHRAVAEKLLPELYNDLSRFSLQWFVCEKTAKLLAGKENISLASSENWDTEYLDLKMNCKIIDSLEAAIRHIEEHGSRHSESIITASEKIARRFQNEIDAAAVYWNASTRFTDGFEFGLGGEIGISTQKLHVRGPVGLRELTSIRWIIDGTGQVRS